MAQLKVKQISDFTSKVNSLITSATTDENASINSLELIDAAQNNSIDALQTAAAAAVGSINSLELIDAAQNNSIDALQSSDVVVNASIDSLEVLAASNTTIADASINSLELVAVSNTTVADASINSLEIEVATAQSGVDAIVAGAAVDLDTFAEVVTFFNSVDTVNDGLLTSFVTAAESSINSLEVVETAQNNSIDALQLSAAAGVGSINSLELIDAAIVNSINSLEDVDTAQNNSIDALQLVDTAQNNSIDSIEVAISSIGGGLVYVKQGAMAASSITFRANAPVRFGTGDDLSVYINGLEIHPRHITVAQGEEFGVGTSTTEGYGTSDGQNFTIYNLGYTLEADDHIHVVGIAQ